MQRLSNINRLFNRSLCCRRNLNHPCTVSSSIISSSSAKLHSCQLGAESRNSSLFASRKQNLQMHRFYSSLPEHTVVGLPNLSPTMETGTIKAWLKKEGDRVEEGDAIAEIETDKSVMVSDSSYSGYLAKILLPEGAKDIPINTPIYILVEEESDIAAFKDYSPDTPPPPSPAAAAESSPTAEQTPTPSAPATDLPDHTIVGFPSLSPTMTTGTLLEWHKKEGDKIEEGDGLAEIETDKSTLVMETSDNGYIAKILIPAGSKDVPINKPMFVLVDDEASIPAFANYTAQETSSKPLPSPPVPSKPSEPTSPTPQPSATVSTQPQTKPKTDGRIIASPLAKTLAKERGIDLSMISGSGPGGRIIAEDVPLTQPAAPSQPTPAVSAAAPTARVSTEQYTDIDLSNMRKTIAKRLTESKQTVPHYYLTVDIHMNNIEELRKQLNSSLSAENKKLSVNDFVIKASALACKKVPAVNSEWMGDFIREYKNVDVCVAVATDNGLITPIVAQAESKGLASINSEVVDLASRAREGKLQPHEFQGGTFTISNLGMFGIKSFTAIINPPQSCILAVGTTSDRIVPDDDSEEGYKAARVMSVTLSCDHRVVDGAVGAQWLAEFRKLMENPNLMLL